MKKLIALLLVCLMPLCALAENTPAYQSVELAADGISVRLLLPEGVTLLSGKSLVKDWDGLPEEYIWLRRSEISLGRLNGVIALDPNAKWDIQWVLLKGENGGDLDELSPVEAEQHCERTIDAYQADGLDVSGGISCWMGAHRYTNVSYKYENQQHQLFYAEEYYTRQNGWNVMVQLNGYGSSAPEEAYALLRGIIESQVVTVTE